MVDMTGTAPVITPDHGEHRADDAGVTTDPAVEALAVPGERMPEPEPEHCWTG